MLAGDARFALAVGAQQDALGTDEVGNAYVVGRFKGTVDFNPGPGTHNLTAANAASGDMFVAKYLPDGSLAWVVQVGNATDAPVAESIALLRGTGSPVLPKTLANLSPRTVAWIAGTFTGTVDFDPSGAGTASMVSRGGKDMFLLGIDQDGRFRVVNRVGRGYDESAVAVTVDASGQLFVVGSVVGNGPNVSTTLYIFSGRGKVLATGNIAAAGNDIVPTAIAADGFSDYFLAGTVSADYDFDPLNKGGIVPGGSAFLLKIDNLGFYNWVGSVAGAVYRDLVTNASSSQGPYSVTGVGTYTGTGDFNFNSRRVAALVSAGGTDAFVARWDSDGNYVWATGFGGTGADAAVSVGADGGGSVYVGGSFQATAAFRRGVSLTSFGGTDGVTVKYSVLGRQSYVSQFGGAGEDAISHIAMAIGADLVASGPLTASGDYDPVGGTLLLQPLAGHTEDLFVVRLD